MLTFYLRKPKSEKTTELCIYGRYYGSRADWRIATGLKVEESKWNPDKGRVRKGATATERAYAKSINDRLVLMADTVAAYVKECEMNGGAVTVDRIHEIFRAVADRKPSPPKTRIPAESLSGYLAFLIGAMERGEFKVAGEDYCPQTIKRWRVFLNVLKDFEGYYLANFCKPLRWEDIGKDVYDAFVSFKRKRGHMTSTINNEIGSFKALIKYSGRYHRIHDNADAACHFVLLKRRENDSRARIYLTPDEVDALYNMELKPGSLCERVRDVFCAGVYCGQRFSDYGRLSPEHFTTTERGTNVIHLTQKKTGQTITVPFLSDNLRAIAAKYDYDLPEISEVIVNKYIKIICRQLSETVPSLAEKAPTTLTLLETRMEERYRAGHGGRDLFERDGYGRVVKPRYELITTHTARRTAITNLFKSHAFTTYQLMAVSGHKSVKNLLLYVRESGDEVADEIDTLLKGGARPGTAGLF